MPRFVLLISLLLGRSECLAQGVALPIELEYNELFNWYWCGQQLVQDAGGDVTQAKLIPSDIHRWSVVKDPEFMEYMLAIAYVESRYNDRAVSRADALGMFQLTFDGASDAASECGLAHPQNWASLDVLHNRRMNVKYASCLLRKYLNETGGNWVDTLILYNGGYRQLTRFNATGTMVNETMGYVVQVLHTKGKCNAVQQPGPIKPNR